ncbi:MAG: carboxylate--amine ligase [Gemmatimonadales bacterium]|nr:MAG: carboxylate--amine ligase [Gemmatimonadales bacterium]
MSGSIALLGWSLPAIETARRMGRDHVVVSFAEFEPYALQHDIPFVAWNFGSWNEQSNALQLRELLAPHGVDVAIPLFEETVEWAGALNSLLRDDPRLLGRSYLFRNKAIMKRKALLAGFRVGLFEEVHGVEQVRQFMKRLNEANLQLPGEEDAWVHLKPFSAAGTVGHKLLRTQADIDARLVPEDFPCLVESHLPGKEFSCEAFIHQGKVRFLNITEYVKLGYSNFVPAGPELEARRDRIMAATEDLARSFGIEYGMLHPEWFLTEDDKLSFGEVACRIPGGHIFELIETAHGFDPIEALILCSDPNVTEEEIAAFFPDDAGGRGTWAGSVMVYPKPGHVSRLEIPEELKEDPFFESHTLISPSEHKVPEGREGFGNHYGTVFFRGDDPDRMRDLLVHYQDTDFFQ